LITGRADEWVHVEIIGKEFKEFKELQGGRARSQEPSRSQEAFWTKYAMHKEQGFPGLIIKSESKTNQLVAAGLLLTPGFWLLTPSLLALRYLRSGPADC
jgi:hypothetical protein